MNTLVLGPIRCNKLTGSIIHRNRDGHLLYFARMVKPSVYSSVSAAEASCLSAVATGGFRDSACGNIELPGLAKPLPIRENQLIRAPLRDCEGRHRIHHRSFGERVISRSYHSGDTRKPTVDSAGEGHRGSSVPVIRERVLINLIP